MNVKDIIKLYLTIGGYDGLCNPGECGCENGDLIPCMEPNEEMCQPAYKNKYSIACIDDDCGIECDRNEKSWCMRLTK